MDALSHESGYSNAYVDELKRKSRQTPSEFTKKEEDSSTKDSELQTRSSPPLPVNTSLEWNMLNQGIPEEAMIKELKDREERKRNIAMMTDNYISLETGDQLMLAQNHKEEKLLQTEDEIQDEGYSGFENYVEESEKLQEIYHHSSESLRTRSIQMAVDQKNMEMELDDEDIAEPIQSWEHTQIKKGAFGESPALTNGLSVKLPNILTMDEQIQRLKEAIASEKLQQEERSQIIKSLMEEELEINEQEEKIKHSFIDLDKTLLNNLTKSKS